MKRISSTVLSLALVLSVVAPVAAGAQSMSGTFNTTLTVGSTGSAVVALQSFLVSKGLLTMPAGVSMGYFGGLTKSAVAAYQISKGIQPSAGYFGPITRAAANADSVGGTTTTTTTPGCSAGALFNSMTGTPCSTTTTTTTSGVEGSVDVLLAPTPTNNANVQTSIDVPVYGIQFKGKIADSVVQTIDLEVSSTLTSDSSTENPSTLINTIKVWDGSNVIATIPVNSATFIKDSSNVYYIRVSGLNFAVPKDVTKNLVVSFSTNSIDTARAVAIDGYGTNSVRVVSGNGISSFYSINALSRNHTFQKPGTATLTLTAVSVPLRSQNFRVNSTDSTIANVLNFNVRSETGDSKITAVTATSTLTGVSAANLVYYLYDGSTLIDSKTGTSSVSFTNLTVNVPKDVTKALTVKIGFPATSTGAYVATTSLTSVTYDKPNGGSATVSTAVNGVAQYVYTKSTNFALTSAPSIVVSNASYTGGTSTMNATFNLSVNPQGGDWVRANAAAVIGWALANNPTLILATSSAAISRVDNIADGSSPVVEFSGNTSAPVSGIVAGSYVAKITSLTWDAGNGAVVQAYGLDDFLTNASATFND